MELPLFAHVAVGVALGIALWESTKWTWSNRQSIGGEIKDFAKIALKASFFAAVTLLVSVYPLPLFSVGGWLQFTVCMAMALGWGLVGIAWLTGSSDRMIAKVLSGGLLLAIALSPARTVIVHLMELLPVLVSVSGVNTSLHNV